MNRIEWRVRELAEARGWNISDLARETGMAYSSALDLWYGRPRRIDFPTLEKLINSLGATPNDIFRIVQKIEVAA